MIRNVSIITLKLVSIVTWFKLMKAWYIMKEIIKLKETGTHIY